MRKKKLSASYYSILEEVEIFQGIDKEELRKLSDKFTLQRYKKGELILKMGSYTNNNFYIINSGSVIVSDVDYIDESGCSTIDFMDKGGFFGEMSLLTEKSHSANVISIFSTELLVLDKLNWNKLLFEFPTIAISLCKVISRWHFNSLQREEAERKANNRTKKKSIDIQIDKEKLDQYLEQITNHDFFEKLSKVAKG